MHQAGKNTDHTTHARGATRRGGAKVRRAVTALSAIVIAWGIGGGGAAEASILILDRQSQAGNTINANGVLAEADSLSTLTGGFAFDSNLIRTVRGGRSNNIIIASSRGQLAVNDAVTVNSPDEVILTVSRSASSVTAAGSGGVASGSQTQLFQVDFRVENQRAPFTLAGTFSPDAIASGSIQIFLGLVGEAGVFEYDQALPITLNEEGSLPPLADPAARYRLLVELTDTTSGNLGPTASSSDFDFTLTLTPEPSSAAILICGALPLLRRRRHGVRHRNG